MNQDIELTREPGTDSAEPQAHGRYEKLPVFVYVLFGFAALALAVYLISLSSAAFSDFFNRYIGSAIRALLSYLTVWIPFSFAECLLLMLPVIVVYLVVFACRRYSGSWRSVFVFIGSVVSVVSLFFSLFSLGFGTGYHGTTLDVKLGIERADVSADELYDTVGILVDLTNGNTDGIAFRGDGSSVMPYSYDEMSKRLVSAYDKVCDEYPFVQRLSSRVKPVMLSEPWTYTHISGVYTYFTGEANINVNFPDYTIPFTAAHEMAHQRGIAREDEANFVAYLVCAASDDPYIRYSGSLSLFEYVGSALYSADSDKYFELLSGLDVVARGEMSAYNLFFEQYRESVAATVTDAVNDTFLKAQGTVGSRSYGMVVDLAVAYYKDR